MAAGHKLAPIDTYDCGSKEPQPYVSMAAVLLTMAAGFYLAAIDTDEYVKKKKTRSLFSSFVSHQTLTQTLILLYPPLAFSTLTSLKLSSPLSSFVARYSHLTLHHHQLQLLSSNPNSNSHPPLSNLQQGDEDLQLLSVASYRLHQLQLSTILRKGRSTISKKDLKISLVAKRLSMLQEDAPQTHLALPESPQENPLPLESIKPSGDISDDDMPIGHHVKFKSSQNQMNHGSHKRARVISDDECDEDIEAIACIPPREKGSHKRTRVISDDECEEDIEAIACIPSRKRGRPKKVQSIDVSNDEGFKTSDTPKAEKFQYMDLIGHSSAGGNKSSIKRAEEFLANLSDDYPSFVKLMSKSHVSGGFWLGMPKKFCDNHLPKHDSIVVLVDEAEREFNTNYLVAKSGLSGGWRGFSIDHDLCEGDAVIFHLIEPKKFKIYILREENYGEVDGALGLLTLDSGLEQQKTETETHIQKALQPEDHCPFTDHLYQSSSDVDLGPEVLDDGIRFSDSDIKFEGVEDFEKFTIIVDGLIIDSKFSENTRKKYFELCCSQGLFLHEDLLKGLNCNLVVGIISETINIADAIDSCKKASVSHEDLQIWEKTLKGFEFLGMKVAFLCNRISQLQDLGLDSTANESNKLKECIFQRTFAGERMKALEDKLILLKETMDKIDSVMDAEMASQIKLEDKIKATTGNIH